MDRKHSATASEPGYEAGRPTYSNPTTVSNNLDLACFVQPADVSVEEYFGRKIMAGDFVVILGVQ